MKKSALQNRPLGLATLFLMMFTLSGCDSVCIGGFCLGTGMEVSERDYDLMNDEFTIAGENTYGDVSLAFELQDHSTINALSFGEEQAATFEKYGVAKSFMTLSDSSLKTYRDRYVIPGKACPASFMNLHLRALMLVGANDVIARELENYELAFHPEGTPFSVSGHAMQHLPHRYTENGKSINLTIPEYIGITSNKGSANRPVTYFLVTSIDTPKLFSELVE